VKKLHDAAVAAMRTPSVYKRLTTLGAEIAPDADTTPQYLGQLVKSEIAKWAGAIKEAGLSIN
jgi:tripartite-type tricarboxylate transporter receptor subunit TctC